MKLELPFPPSINGYWRAFKRGNTCTQIISQKGRDYRSDVLEILKDNLEVMDGRLMVKITLCSPDKRKRDIDNYAKGILDSLTHAEVWEDDELIDMLVIERGEVVKDGKAVVEIMPYQDIFSRLILPFEGERVDG